LERDKEGMKAVVRAREMAKLMDEKNDKSEKGKRKDAKKEIGKAKGKPRKSRFKESDDSNSDTDLVVEDSTMTGTQKNAYSAQIVKQLGFDPTMKPGQKRADDMAVKKKLETLTALQSARKDVELGPRPGQRIRSGVSVPSNRCEPANTSTADFIRVLDDSDDELEREEIAIFGKPLDKMVDLDGSSDAEDHS
jgi:minichromosome maintenance protein 10